MGFKRYATAHWEGDLKTGQGRMSTPQSGLFEGTRYSFNTRFGEEKGTNPEELLAAAHAGCYSMALANSLAGAGFVARSVHTTADVNLGKDDKGFLITRIDLTVVADVPGVDNATFQEWAEKTRTGCIIARALAATETTLKATLK